MEGIIIQLSYFLGVSFGNAPLKNYKAAFLSWQSLLHGSKPQVIKMCSLLNIKDTSIMERLAKCRVYNKDYCPLIILRELFGKIAGARPVIEVIFDLKMENVNKFVCLTS